MSTSDRAIAHFDHQRAAYLEDLKVLARIPSVSFDGFDPAQVRRSADATAKLLRERGFHNVQLLELAAARPYVYAEIRKRPGAPARLGHAHPAVEPAGDREGRNSRPVEPAERGGRRDGRGSADDKAGVVVHTSAVDAWLKTAG